MTDLQCHLPAEARVAGEVDGPHAALAQAPDDLVRSERIGQATAFRLALVGRPVGHGSSGRAAHRSQRLARTVARLSESGSAPTRLRESGYEVLPHDVIVTLPHQPRNADAKAEPETA